MGVGYSWAESSHPSFFSGRQASISAFGQQVGTASHLGGAGRGGACRQPPMGCRALGGAAFCGRGKCIEPHLTNINNILLIKPRLCPA